MKLYEPKFGSAEARAINKVLKTGQLSQGKEVEKFEKEFAEYVGSKYAVAVNSCTSALFLSLVYSKQFLGVKVAQIPTITFVSVANVIRQADLLLDFTDNINVGFRYPLVHTPVVDSAHELRRGIYKEMPGTMMCFSFYPTKPLGGAEGGMIALDDEKAYKWLRKARGHGMERRSNWDYTVEFPGWKMNMTDVQAAILSVRLKKLDKVNSKRKEISKLYYKLLFGEDKVASLHIMPVFAKSQKKMIDKMAEAGIETSVHFKPIHLQPAYKRHNPKLDISEWWGSIEVSLPMHENLSYNDVKYIAMEANKWIM